MAGGSGTGPQGTVQTAGQVVLEAEWVLWHLAEAPGVVVGGLGDG